MKIAAFQRYPMFDDPERLCALVARDLLWAEGEGAAIALFPEAFLLGHSYDAAVIAGRAARVSGGALAGLCDRIRGAAPLCVIGAFERLEEGIANNAIVISRGAVIGRYAKAHPNEPGVRAGTDFPVFAHEGLRFGINICNDANNPAAAQRLADQGAGLILYPLGNLLPAATAARWRTRSIATLQDRARQTGCWIASADVTGTHGDSISHGCTAIVRPDGSVAARAAEGREGVALFDIPAPSREARAFMAAGKTRAGPKA